MCFVLIRELNARHLQKVSSSMFEGLDALAVLYVGSVCMLLTRVSMDGVFSPKVWADTAIVTCGQTCIAVLGIQSRVSDRLSSAI